MKTINIDDLEYILSKALDKDARSIIMNEVEKIATGENDVTIDQLIEEEIALYDIKRLALGHILYETIRLMSPREFKEVFVRNLEGENFDQIIIGKAKENIC